MKFKLSTWRPRKAYSIVIIHFPVNQTLGPQPPLARGLLYVSLENVYLFETKGGNEKQPIHLGLLLHLTCV